MAKSSPKPDRQRTGATFRQPDTYTSVFGFDTAARLVTDSFTPTSGTGATTRAYALNADSNRTTSPRQARATPRRWQRRSTPPTGPALSPAPAQVPEPVFTNTTPTEKPCRYQQSTVGMKAAHSPGQ